MRLGLWRAGLCMMIFCGVMWAAKIAPIDFKVYDMPTQDSQGPSVLIMSGIQGDEPGAYNATNLLLQYYTIKKGNVRVIPVLSPHSMFYNNRGVYGDLNRKFATLSEQDPEYGIIQKIKEQILRPEVQAIFHMHDGSGFYRETYINEMLNPQRWGNCSIIDQDSLDVTPYGNLKDIIAQIVRHTNTGLLQPLHKYHIHNTHTATKDTEMQKSLTFFAITHDKPAFAHEASKTLPLREKTYYHLLGIEGFFKAVGIEYERNFMLTPTKIAQLINDPNITFSIDSLITLPLFNLKSPLNYFPMPESAKVRIQDVRLDSQSYIIGLMQREDGTIGIKYGGRTMGVLKPLYLEFDHSLPSVQIRIDGQPAQEVKMGAIIQVKQSFFVESSEGYRANVIGFVKPGDSSPKPQEFDTLISKKNMHKAFAIDKKERMYRVEFYKDEAFAGMIIIEFVP